MTTSQDRNPEQGIPAWLINRLGKLVQTRVPLDEATGVIPVGRRGLLTRICSKSMWGTAGVYCLVSFNPLDLLDETHVEISQLQPVDMRGIRG
jgi:hypothetical protein